MSSTQTLAPPENVSSEGCDSTVIQLSAAIPFNMDDSYYRHATAEHFWIQWRFAELQRMFPAEQYGQRVLEVGCGNGVARGQFENWLQRPVDGCDVNRPALDLAPVGRGQIYQYNILDRRPEWASHFDTILLLDCLEHIETPIEFLEAVRFHLKPGGHLLINVPAMPFLYSRYDSVQGHVERYTTERLQCQLESAGLEPLRMRYWGASMVPIAWLRKWRVARMPAEEVLSSGFAPPGRLSESVLRLLASGERSLLPWRPWGTSLAAAARTSP